MGRRIEESSLVSGLQVDFERPTEHRLGLVGIVRGDSGRDLSFVKSVHADSHLLQERHGHRELGLGRDVPDLEVHDVLAVLIDRAHRHLPALTLGLLVLLLGLLFLFDDALDQHIAKLGSELVD